MRKPQASGVQRLAAHAEIITAGAVRAVADDRMPDRRAMDADLMCAARFEAYLQERDVGRRPRSPEHLGDAEMRDGPPAFVAHGEARAIFRVAAYRRINSTAGLCDLAVDEGVVFALDL